jgi:hypothetical protein
MPTTIEQRNTYLALRARRLLAIEGRSVRHALVALALAAPLALVGIDGAAHVIGLCYAGIYLALVAVPTALDLLLMFDASRVIIGRAAAVVPFFLAIVELSKQHVMPEPRSAWIRALVIVGVRGAPLTPFASEAWLLAIRFRPEVWRTVKEQATELAARIREAKLRPPTPRFVVADVQEWQRDVSHMDLVGSC